MPLDDNGSSPSDNDDNDDKIVEIPKIECTCADGFYHGHLIWGYDTTNGNVDNNPADEWTMPENVVDMLDHDEYAYCRDCNAPLLRDLDYIGDMDMFLTKVTNLVHDRDILGEMNSSVGERYIIHIANLCWEDSTLHTRDILRVAREVDTNPPKI
jgi:hypothetical protein